MKSTLTTFTHSHTLHTLTLVFVPLQTVNLTRIPWIASNLTVHIQLILNL